MDITTLRSLATEMAALCNTRKEIEAREKAIKETLLKEYPDIIEGKAPPYWKVSLRDTVSLDTDKAVTHFVKHPDHRVFFKLSLSKPDFLKLAKYELGELKSAPVITPDKESL